MKTNKTRKNYHSQNTTVYTDTYPYVTYTDIYPYVRFWDGVYIKM